LRARRPGRIVRAFPNTNLIAERTDIPTLADQHDPGEQWLACAVLASPNAAQFASHWDAPPPWTESILEDMKKNLSRPLAGGA
jgi:hypothetical protein